MSAPRESLTDELDPPMAPEVAALCPEWCTTQHLGGDTAPRFSHGRVCFEQAGHPATIALLRSDPWVGAPGPTELAITTARPGTGATELRLDTGQIRGLAEFVAALPAPTIARALTEAADLVAPTSDE